MAVVAADCSHQINMSRFSNLEFGQDSDSDARSRQSGGDATRCLGEAQEAFEQADFERALRLYAKAVEFAPLVIEPWSGQVRALIELGRHDEARRWADQALERFARAPELLAAKAVALGRGGDLEGAISFSDASIEEHGHSPYIWLARGDVLLARSEKRADYCFDKALGLAPGSWLVAWLAARVRAFHRQFALALKLVERAIESRVDHAALWLMAGTCQRELGLIGAAKTSMQQALELKPGFPEAARALDELAHAGWGARMSGWWRRHFNE